MPPRRMNRNSIERLIAHRVATAIAKYEINQATTTGTSGAGPVVAGGNAGGNVGGNVGGNTGGNAGGNAGGNIAPEVRGCTYNTFLACNPHTFSGTKGIVGLSRWFEKLESVFQISKCANEDRVKYVVGTLHGRALTWWNDYGLPEKIQGNVTSYKPATTHEAIRMAHNLMDQVVHAKAARGSDRNKHKWEDHQRKTYAGNLPFCNRCKLHHNGPCIVKCRKCQRVGHQTNDYWSKTPAGNTSPADDTD
ncbi:hypothetical protein Tco_0193967 [Tanacetum coccineum]